MNVLVDGVVPRELHPGPFEGEGRAEDRGERGAKVV